MRNVTPDFQGHLDSECITLSNCWRINLNNGSRLGFTDHDVDISFDETLFEAASGFEASQVESSNSLTPDNHEIVGALQSERLTEKDIISRVYDDARVEHFIVNWSNPEQRILMHTYLMGEISRNDGVFSAELRSLSAVLDQTNMRRFDTRCNADFGDNKCGVDVASHTVSATVTGLVSNDKITVSGIEDKNDHWFSGGKVTFVSGSNAGRSIEVVDSSQKANSGTDSLLTLWAPPHEDINSGDQIEIYPGCDKYFSTCGKKYFNSLNFRGFPHMPGTDFSMSYANNSEKMDGGPLIK